MLGTLMMKAVRSSEMLVNIYKTAWSNIPKDSLFILKIIPSNHAQQTLLPS
jgi:hypothetical protein